MRRYFLLAVSSPLSIIKFLYARFFFIYILRACKGVYISKNVKLRGMPIIDIVNGSKLIIAEGCLVDSMNFGYHVNQFSPVKMFIDNELGEISIGENTRIHGACLHASYQIAIGKNCLIGSNTQIFDSSGHELLLDDPSLRINSKDTAKPISIGDNVWIGSGVTVLPGVTIHDGAVIAAGSVVTKDVQPNVLVAGNPAKIVREAGPNI